MSVVQINYNLLKKQAVSLRKKGLSYSEILKKVPVAKSTLSLWLRDVKLSKKQRQKLTKRKLLAAKKGGEARRQKRILITEKIKKKAEKEIGRINKRDLWILGIALYWGEGHKEKLKSSLVKFTNSDYKMIKIFLKWLLDVCGISKKDIYFRIFLHETAKNRLLEVQNYWAKITGFPIENFQKISWKKHKIRTKRKNIGQNYFGLLRVEIRKSTNFNRKIQGWIEGICKKCGVV